MARTTIVQILSDLSGKVIKDEAEVAEVRVLSHPLINRPVKIEAQVLEVASLENTSLEMVTIELVLPNTPPEKLVLERAVFDNLFSNDVEEVLGSAEPYDRYGLGSPAKRGRPKGAVNRNSSPGPKRSPEQTQAIRAWGNANGFRVAAKARIANAVVEAFEAAHAAQ